MSTTTRFEDRLLEVLKQEIGLREEGEVGEVGGDSAGADASERRPGAPLLNRRRIALAATACAVAGLAVVVVPGTPADSMAYAVERHGDGRVTVTLRDQRIDLDAQYELARELRPNGIEVDVEVLEPGYSCKPWGRAVALQLLTVGKDGVVHRPAGSWTVPVRVTLSRGNVLVFENSEGRAEPQAVHAYEIDRYELDASTTRTGSTSCVPVKDGP